MKKEIKSVLCKIVLCIVLYIIFSTIIKAFEPTLSTQVAVDQLNGGDYGFAQLAIYNNIKYYASFGYLVFIALFFSPNIARGITLFESHRNTK